MVVFCLIVLGMISSGASSDQSFGSHVATDLGITAKLDSVFERIDSISTYKIIAHDDSKVSWSFSKTGKSDSGSIYSTGRLEVGSQDGFGPAVGDRLESELKAEIDLLPQCC